MQGLRTDLLFYIHHLYPADFMLVMLVAFLFIVFLIFIIIMRDKGWMVGILFFFIIAGLPAIAISGEMLINQVARTRTVTLDSAKIYKFSNSLHVVFSLKNQSRNTFSYCKVLAKLYAKTDANASTWIKYKNMLQVLRRKSVVTKIPIKPKGTYNSKIIFKDFRIKIPYEIKLDSTCF